MRLGMFMMPLHPAGRPMHAYLAEDSEKILLLEKLGYDEVFIGEHFSAATEPYPSPLMFASSLLPQTKHISFGTGVISAALRHPAFIAGEAAQFDHMSKGRFILGIGTGSTPSDIEMMGVSFDNNVRHKMLRESVDMIQKIWASDPPYDIPGEFFNTRISKTVNEGLGFGWLSKPYQPGGPPIAIPVSTPDSSSVKVAGSKGWSVISSQLLAPEALALHWKNYCDGAKEAGRAIDGDKWRVCRSIHVAATDEEARQHIYHPQSGYRHFYGHMHKVYSQIGRLGAIKPRPDMRDDEVTVDTFIEARTIFGSPQTVIRALTKLRQEVGPFGTLLLTAVDWAGPNAAWERESLARIAEEVMPAFRQNIAATVAAE